MTYRQVHFLEKLEFQITAVAAVAVVYWLTWPLLIPSDPELPMVFLAGGVGAGHVFVLLGLACVVGLVCGAATLTARPQTAAMALVFGLLGLAFRSPRLRALLWTRQDSLGAMYWRLGLEVLVLLAVIFIAAVAAGVGRQIAATVARNLLWQDPLLELDEERREEYNRLLAEQSFRNTEKEGAEFQRKLQRHLRFGPIFGLLLDREMDKLPGRDTIVRGVLGFMISTLVSAIVIFLLLRSPERGQILFSLFAGCFLGVFIGQRFSPTRCNLVAWAVPVSLGVFLYILAAVSSVRSGQGAWIEVDNYYRVLPIDWMTAGLGGAMLGHWEDLRMREARYIEDSLEALEE